MAAVLMLIGALLVIGGTACFSIPTGVIVAGLVLIGAGVDLARPGPRDTP